MIEVSAVACRRGNKFDAEVQLRWGDFDNPQYKQVRISSGHDSREEAKKAAQSIADVAFNNARVAALKVISAYSEAKP